LIPYSLDVIEKLILKDLNKAGKESIRKNDEESKIPLKWKGKTKRRNKK
jgi:hypothetical protein